MRVEITGMGKANPDAQKSQRLGLSGRSPRGGSRESFDQRFGRLESERRNKRRKKSH